MDTYIHTLSLSGVSVFRSLYPAEAGMLKTSLSMGLLPTQWYAEESFL